MLMWGKNELHYIAHSDVGDKRDVNEDNFFAAVEKQGKRSAGLFAVADGCGGMQYGDEASRITAEEVSNAWGRLLESDTNIFRYTNNLSKRIDEILEEMIQKAHLSVIELGNRLNCDPASTLSILFISDGHYWIKHVGDSRIYRFRNGSLERLTEDQTMLADMIRNGEINETEACNYKRSILSMSIGIKGKVYSYSNRGNVLNGDIFLICSDGFYSFADESRICEVLAEGINDSDKLRKIIDDGKASDNVTFIAVYSA